MGKKKVQLPTFLKRNNSQKQTKGQKEKENRKKKKKSVGSLTCLTVSFP
jgi:hypothetical protein